MLNRVYIIFVKDESLDTFDIYEVCSNKSYAKEKVDKLNSMSEGSESVYYTLEAFDVNHSKEDED